MVQVLAYQAKKYMVPRNRWVGFLVTQSIHWLLFLFIYLFFPKQDVWVNTCWVLSVLWVPGVTRMALSTGLEAACVQWGDWSIQEGKCQLQVVTHGVAQRQASGNLITNKEEEPVCSPREWKGQEGRGFEQCKDHCVLPGGLRLCQSESDDPPPAPVIPIEPDYCAPPHLRQYCTAPGGCCCLCLECPLPSDSFPLTF